MHVYVQKSTSTTFPRRPAAVSGGEFNQVAALRSAADGSSSAAPIAPSNDFVEPIMASSHPAMVAAAAARKRRRSWLRLIALPPPRRPPVPSPGCGRVVGRLGSEARTGTGAHQGRRQGGGALPPQSRRTTGVHWRERRSRCEGRIVEHGGAANMLIPFLEAGALKVSGE